MRIPKPRLRQVFEHTTHFKVQKPGAAKPITIAKSALSPNMTMRLRQFARGTGSVPTQAEANAAARAADEALFAPTLTEPQPLKPAVVDSSSAPEDLEIPAASEPVVPVAAAPAPVPVAVAAPAAAPQSQELVLPPFAPPAPQPVTLGVGELTSPTPAPAVSATPAPVVVPPAPAAPAPAAPLTITIPSSITGTTPADFDAAIKANPEADRGEVMKALFAKANPEIPPPDFATITPAVEPEGTAIERFDKAAAVKAAALTAEAKEDFTAKQELAKIAQQNEMRQLEAVKKDSEVSAKLAERRAALEEAVNKGFEPKSFFSRMDTGQKIGSTIALAIGGFLSGATNTPNYVLDAFSKAADRDLDVQKGKYNSLLKQYERVLGDEEDAQKLAKADLLNLQALQIKTVEARSNLRAIGPQLQGLRADLDMKAAGLREDVRKKMYEGDIAKANADMQEEYRNAQIEALRRKGLGRAGAGGGAATPNLEFRKAKWEKGRTFSVPDPADPSKSIYIKAPNETVARQKIDTITSRIEGTMALEDFEKWLEQHKDENFNPTTIQEMRLKIANVVEKYPSTMSNSKGLVTVAQKDIIGPAIQSTNLPIIKYLDALGLTSAAIKILKKDAIRGVKSAVQGAADENDPGAAEFFNKWSEQGYHGRFGIPAQPRAAVAPQPSAGSTSSMPTPAPAGMVKVKHKGQIGLIPAANLQEALKRGATVVP